jgi:hypothetical protein
MTHPVFVIDKQFMLHEGGTKFYQVLRILTKDPGDLPHGAGGRSVTLTHWGPLKGAPGLRRIVDGGSCKVEAGDSYASAQSKKKSRGYQVTDVRWGESTRIPSLAMLRTELTDELGASLADEVLDDLIPLPLRPEEKPYFEPSEHKREKKTTPEVPESSSMDGWGEF